MTGYQEVLTDPSYRKQVIVFSSAQIGNQGFHADDFESQRIWASGCAVHDYSEPLFHWRKQWSLDEVLKQNQCPGLSGVDTRRLILRLRREGSLWGVISTETDSKAELSRCLKGKLNMEGLSLTSEVTSKSSYTWVTGSVPFMQSGRREPKGGLRRCVVIDLGVKRQILRYLVDAGFHELVVVPAHTRAHEIRALAPQALFLSNGPGDPAAETELIQVVRSLLGEWPTFGVCLGHQILALALGLETFKLSFGHHGANHPVKNLKTGTVEISSQNHGFSVRVPQARSPVEITHLNLNDQTVEGFAHKKLPLWGLQFHPEASPGPMDSISAFQSFQQGTLSA